MLPKKKPTKGVYGTRRADGPLRSPGHLQWLRTSCACVVPGCEQRKIEAAHVRIGSHAGLAQKPPDDMAIPLCWIHHAQQHRVGEGTFGAMYGLNLRKLAESHAAASPALRRLRGRQSQG